MRIISFSVEGIHQAAQRGLFTWLAQQQADIICLQDVRASMLELERPEFALEGYFAYFFDSGQKHYSGVAIYTRWQPKAVIYGLGFSSGVDMEGRYIQVDYEGYSIGSLLAPGAQVANECLEVKTQFFDDLQALLYKIARKRRSFIFCGNWEMAHSRKDVQDWENNQQNPGFLPHEQLWLTQVFNGLGYCDAFRQYNQDADEFTWWPSGTVGKGAAWRTDFQVASVALQKKIEYASIYKKQVFSSHLPVVIDYDIEDLNQVQQSKQRRAWG